jgi:hypothetical protein
VNNFFCISLGMLVTILVSLFIFAYDFENKRWFQYIKTLAILLFLGASTYFFVTTEESYHLDHSAWDDVPVASAAFGYVIGIFAFSYS